MMRFIAAFTRIIKAHNTPNRLRLPSMVLSLTILTLAATAAAEVDSLLGPPPGNYRLLSPDSVARIPFQIFRGDVLMHGFVNGREVRMMIDNGSVWDELLFWGSPLIDSLGLHYNGEASVGGQGEGAEVPSRTASEITIKFPGVEFTNQTAIVTPFSSGFSKMWEGTEGQVSGTFLKHFVVDINFDTKILTLLKPDDYRYTGEGVGLPLKPYPDGSWSIPGKIRLEDGRTLDLDFILDLGFNDALQIDPRETHKIPVPGKTIAASLGFGVQGETRGYIGRVRSITFGEYELKDVVTGFVSPDDSAAVRAEAMIGLGLMSRFNIVFDYPHHRMFVVPNHQFAKTFEYDMTGMVLRKGKGDYQVITRVYPDSPASEAGLAVGDTITQIKGAAAGKCDIFELSDLFLLKNSKVNLVILRDSKEVPVVLTLRRVI
jgi:hypothetical protein